MITHNEDRQPGNYWVVWNRSYGKVIARYNGAGHWTVGTRCLIEKDLPYIGIERIEPPEHLSINPYYDKNGYQAGK